MPPSAARLGSELQDQCQRQGVQVAAALVAVACGLIAPFVVIRGMSFAVHGTAELAFTGAAAGLLVADNAVAGALVGSLVVAVLIATLGSRPRERDSAIGAILAFGMGIGILLLGFYRGFATAATNILFGNIFGVSGSQLLILAVINLLVVAVMATWYRPLLFASVDPEAAEARGVPVGRLGLVFLLVLALTVTAPPGGRHPARAQPGHHPGRRRPAPVGQPARRHRAVRRLRRGRGRRRPAGQLRSRQHQGERLHHQHQLRHLPRRPPGRPPAPGPPPAAPSNPPGPACRGGICGLRTRARGTPAQPPRRPGRRRHRLNLRPDRGPAPDKAGP